jgi:predicted dehydrogenase
MTIQLALVGAAHIHLPGFIKRIKDRGEQFAVRLVWDHNADRASMRAAELGARVVQNLDEIWNDPDIQAVVICSETNRHEDLVIAAAKAGKPMFVEKPLGLGAEDSGRMADAIDHAAVAFQTGYFMRGSPILRFIKDQIDVGSFGQITRLRMENCHSGSLGGWFDTEWRWMADVSQSGVGGFGDLGTHVLDIMLWMLGDVSSVTADIEVGTARYPDCDEIGEGMLKFKNGVIGTLAAGWTDVANPVRLELSGTKGHALVLNDQLYFKSQSVEGADGKTPWTQLPEPWPHAFELFLDTVAGKSGVPLVAAHEAAYRSAVMKALYTASREKRWVNI